MWEVCLVKRKSECVVGTEPSVMGGPHADSEE